MPGETTGPEQSPETPKIIEATDVPAAQPETSPAMEGLAETRPGDVESARSAIAEAPDTTDPSYAVNKLRQGSARRTPGVDLPESHEVKAQREADWREREGLSPKGEKTASQGLLRRAIDRLRGRS